MPVGKEKYFEECPLCHDSAIGGQSTRRGFWRSVNVSRCPTCGALFISSGQNRYRLQSCDPARLGAARGKKGSRSGCSDCPPIPECYLDRPLSASDWEHIGRGEPTDGDKAFLERSEKMEAGKLPVLPAEQSPVAIEAGEELHHVATVYTCEQVLPEESRDEGKLVVTSRRLVLVSDGGSLEINLDEIDRLETAYPGFLVYKKGSTQPFCFFPLRGDPVFHAIKGALRKARL